jgi:hypothetical protein
VRRRIWPHSEIERSRGPRSLAAWIQRRPRRGRFRQGHVRGATDPSGDKKDPSDKVMVADLHATIQQALGIDPTIENITAANRPVALSEGRILKDLLSDEPTKR